MPEKWKLHLGKSCGKSLHEYFKRWLGAFTNDAQGPAGSHREEERAMTLLQELTR